MSRVSRKVLSKYLTSVPFSKYFLASSGYKLTDNDYSELSNKVSTGAWDLRMSNRQQKTWDNILESTLENQDRSDIQNLIKSINIYATGRKSILEIGSGACYNSVFIKKICPNIAYFGLDSSLESLLLNYDDKNILINCSADKIGLKSKSIDVLMDGATLIHLPNWADSLQEYFRVTKDIIILHSINISNNKHFTFSKYAYGKKIFEQCFDRSYLEKMIKSCNWSVMEIYAGLDYDLSSYFGKKYKSQSETWVLKR
jgi:ubiquinone/menaquinone biosynthesis C-methylase UbiE